MRRACLLCLITAVAARGAPPPVRVTVDVDAGRRPISPYLYGKNGVFGQDGAELRLAVEANLRMTRESHGNNCTKYNWRDDLSSHPDWYNNVYRQGLHERAQRLNAEFDSLQGLFGLQVLGWVAATDAANFREQEVNPRPPVRDNLAGGGDPARYLKPWTAAETVGILDYWFGPGGLGLDPGRFRYWHLDNEPECWSSTHDDVWPTEHPASECVEKYIEVASELRRRHPGARIMAPGFTSEWMWWNWNNGFVDGMPWMQYFVKRMAEAGRERGQRLLDVVDFHTYIGGDATDEELLQEHRIFYDPSYRFPRANGCKRFPDGGWHEDQQVELVFGRMEAWLDEYFGPGHQITIGVTEAAVGPCSEMTAALWYAAMLGTFADHGVEVFTPWDWRDSWWEVLHLFSRYAQPIRVATECDGEPLLSGYASHSEDGAALTVILLNRSPVPRRAEVAVRGFAPSPGEQQVLQLCDLPDHRRTFATHNDNALRLTTATAGAGVTAVELPAYSISALLLR